MYGVVRKWDIVQDSTQSRFSQLYLGCVNPVSRSTSSGHLPSRSYNQLWKWSITTLAGSWWHASLGVGLTVHINPSVELVRSSTEKEESLILHIHIAPVREPRSLCCKHYSAIVWSIAKDETQVTMHVHFICTSCIQGTVEAYYMPCKFSNHVLQLFFSLDLLCTGPGQRRDHTVSNTPHAYRTRPFKEFSIMIKLRLSIQISR